MKTIVATKTTLTVVVFSGCASTEGAIKKAGKKPIATTPNSRSVERKQAIAVINAIKSKI